MKKLLFSVFTIVCLFSCGGNSNNKGKNDKVLKTVSEQCSDCGGDGFINKRCSQCDGDGYIDERCSHCNGRGVSLVRKQSTQKITCNTCGGSGHVACPTCGGHGYMECNSCGGTGRRTCVLCKGNGRLYILGEVTTCPSCKGGGAEICVVCDGSGYRQCSKYTVCTTCYGDGIAGVQPVVQEEYVTCERCNGNRYIRVHCNMCNGNSYIQTKCSTCNGKGRVSFEKWVEE